MKQHFITGLALLLPLALTFLIVGFLLNLLTGPFIGIVQPLLFQIGFFQNGFWIFTSEQIVRTVSQILVLIVLFGLTVVLGYFARWVLFHYFIRFAEALVHRIPFINTIYKTSQDVIKTIFTSDTRSFKQVVLLPFPHASSYAVGLITRENFEGNTLKERVAVFVPTTPNPTSGFLMMVKRSDVIYLDMKIEEALKYIISCGVILGEFKHMNPEEIKEKATEAMTS